MPTEDVRSPPVRFAILALTMFLSSLFSPFVEYGVPQGTDDRPELNAADDEPDWTSTAIETDEILIQELLIDPLGVDAGNERIVLWNNDSSPADVGGWRLVDASLSSLYAFPDDYVMRPYSSYVIALGEGEDIGPDDTFSPILLHTGSTQEHLHFSGGALALLDDGASSAVIDFVAWGDGSGTTSAAELQAVAGGQWTTGDFVDTRGDWLSEGEGLVRERGIMDTNSSSDFIDQPEVVINEIALDVADTEDGGEWIELFNPGAATWQMGGWVLASNNSTLYVFPSEALLPGGKNVIVHLGQQIGLDDYFLGQSLDWLTGDVEVYAQLPSTDYFQSGENASGDVALSTGDILDFVAWGTPSSSNMTLDALNAGIWISGDAVSITTLTENDSIGRKKDGGDTDSSSDWAADGGEDANGPTPGMWNSMSVTILDANWSVPGAEVLIVANHGTDIEVAGWKVMNHTRQTESSLPAFSFSAGSSLRIVFDQGSDDLDLSDGEGTVHIGSLGTLVDGEGTLLVLWSGNADDGSLIDFSFFENGQPYGSEDGTRGRFTWGEVWDIGVMLGGEAVAFIKSPWDWVKEKAYAALNWAIGEIKSGALGSLADLVDIEVAPGDGTVILWTVTFSSGADFSIPLGIPGLFLDISIEGTVVIQKTCTGLGGGGTLVITAAVTLGKDIKFVHLSISAGIEATISYPGEMATIDTGTTVSGKVVASISAFVSATAKIDIFGYSVGLSKTWSWPLFTGSLQITKAYTRDCDGHYDETYREGNPEVELPYGEQNPFEPGTSTANGPYTYVPRPGDTTWVGIPVGIDDRNGANLNGSNAAGWNDAYYDEWWWPSEENSSRFETEYFAEVTVPPADELVWIENIVQFPYPPPDDGGGGGGGGGGPTCDCSGAVVVHDIYVGNDADVITNQLTIVAENKTNSSLSDTAILDLHLYEIYNITVTSEHGWPVRVQGADQLWGMRKDEPHHLQIIQEVPVDAEVGTIDKITVTIQSVYDPSNVVTIERFTQVAHQPLTVEWIDHLDPSPDSGWTALDGDWEHGAPGVGPASAASSPNVWGTSLNGNYSNDANHELQTPAMDLSALSNAQLQFSEWYEVDGDSWDDVKVEAIDLDTGDILFLSPTRSGVNDASGAWTTHHIGLKKEHLLPNMAFRFTLSASWDGNARGWYIDDVAVVTCEQPLSEIELLQGPAEHGGHVDEGNHTYTTVISNPSDGRVDQIDIDWTLERSKFEVISLHDFDDENEWAAWATPSGADSISFMRDDDGGQRAHTPQMNDGTIIQVTREKAGADCAPTCDASANVGGMTGGAEQSAGPEFSYGDGTDASLISPAFDLSGRGGELWLRFAMRADLAPRDDRVTLSYSENDGGAWSEVDQWLEDDAGRTAWLCCAPGDWTIHTIPIATTQSEKVRFRWTVESDERYAGEMVAIDDVAILLRTTSIVMQDSRQNLTLESESSLSFQHDASLQAIDDELTLYTMNVNMTCECMPEWDERKRSHSVWVLPEIVLQFSELVANDEIKSEIMPLTLVSVQPILALGGEFNVEISALDESCSMTDTAVATDLRDTYAYSFNVSSCNDGPLQVSAALEDWWGRTFIEMITVDLLLIEPEPPDAIDAQIISDPAPSVDDGVIHCELETMVELSGSASSGEGGITNWTWTLQDETTKMYGASISVECADGSVTLEIEDSIGQTGNVSMAFFGTEVIVEPPDGERGLKVENRTTEEVPDFFLPKNSDIYQDIQKAIWDFANNSSALQDIERQISNHTEGKGSGNITVEYFILNRSDFIEQYVNDTSGFEPPGTAEEAGDAYDNNDAYTYTTSRDEGGRQVIRVVFFADRGIQAQLINQQMNDDKNNASNYSLYRLIIHEFVHVKLYAMDVWGADNESLPFQDHDDGFFEEIERLLKMLVTEFPQTESMVEEQACAEDEERKDGVCVAVNVDDVVEEDDRRPLFDALGQIPIEIAVVSGAAATFLLIFFKFRKKKSE